jgi:predicted site-specific integrase-resolvase
MPARTLTLTRPAAGTTAHQPIRVVLYVRVSSKDQEAEGFSIPAQVRLLREYAASKGFVIVLEFVDIETAKASGRTHFSEMLAYLKKHPRLVKILVRFALVDGHGQFRTSFMMNVLPCAIDFNGHACWPS